MVIAKLCCTEVAKRGHPKYIKSEHEQVEGNKYAVEEMDAVV